MQIIRGPALGKIEPADSYLRLKMNVDAIFQTLRSAGVAAVSTEESIAPQIALLGSAMSASDIFAVRSMRDSGAPSPPERVQTQGPALGNLRPPDAYLRLKRNFDVIYMALEQMPATRTVEEGQSPFVEKALLDHIGPLTLKRAFPQPAAPTARPVHVFRGPALGDLEAPDSYLRMVVNVEAIYRTLEGLK